MPHEGMRHDQLWVAWPTSGYTLGDSAEDAETARLTWAAVANAAAEFEPLTVVVAPADAGVAAKYLSSAIELRVQPIDDGWIRDSGPSFVVDGASLGAVTWVFNGWGQQEWARWGNDALLGPVVADWAVAERVESATTGPSSASLPHRAHSC